MTYKRTFEAVNRLLQYVQIDDSPIGSVTVVLSDDFRQNIVSCAKENKGL